MQRPTGKKYPVNRAVIAEHRLGVPLIRQELSNWCWAACAEMVLRFRHHLGVSQCHLANSALNLSGVQCCPDNPLCDRGLKDGPITSLWNNNGIPAYLSSGLNCNLVKNEIDNGRPVELGFAQGKKGHVVIVDGWRQTTSGLFFLINNPSGPAKQKILCTTLLGWSQNGTWNATWRGL